MVVLPNTPLYHIKYTEVRRWFGIMFAVSERAIAKEILYLVQLVKQRIASNVQGKKGSIVIVDSTRNRMHYVAEFTSYSKIRLVRKISVLFEDFVECLLVLEITPIKQ